ncbi:Antiviral helicase ski2, variant 2, partial [Basidiobolus ranarum]
TLKRPVPLEHFLFAEKEIFKIVDAKKNFSTVGWKNANDALTGIKAKEKAKPGRGGATAGRQTSYRAMEKQDRNLWIHLVGLLKKKSLLPVVVFTFSKKKCEEYASGLTNTDLTSATEKSEIHVFIERSLVRLKGTDKELPQVMKVRDLLSRGIAVHHGGLLPIIKEMVEILFARNLVKVLFATETFAMGVNMPARTVVFSGIRKHDGKSFRELLPGEYTQMSGRAGRRGLDSTGVVIIACGGDAAPETAVLNKMILGQPTKLESQFRLTYNMILNLLRVEALKVEEMIKRSFSENASQKQLPERQKAFAESEKSLNSLEKLDCTICVPDIYNYYDTSSRILELSHQLMAKIANLPIGMKASSPGRIIILNNRFYRNSPAVILRNATSGTAIRSSNERFLWCLILTDKNHEVLETDEDYSEGIAPLPVTRVALPDATSYAHRIEAISFSDIAIITRNSLKLDPEAILDRVNDVEISRVTQELFKYAEEANSSTILEYDWSKIRELEFQEQSKEKDILFSKLDKFQCIRCPDMSEHYTMVHGERLLKAKVTELQHIISDQNLELLPDYHQRIEVLKQLKFIDENCTVSLKGRLGCEINSADELIVTELILDNILAEFEPAEIVALLSCFVFQEKNSSPPSLTPRLEKGQKIILDIATRVAETQEKCGLNVRAEDYIHTLKFGLSEVVYEWAKGMVSSINN